MGVISTSMDHENGITIHAVKGEVTVQKIIHKIEEYMAGKPTRLILWDFTEGSINQIPSEDFQMLAETARKYADARKGGKTALVSQTQSEHGLGRMLQSYLEMGKFQFEIRNFNSLEEAKQWLGIEY